MEDPAPFIYAVSNSAGVDLILVRGTVRLGGAVTCEQLQKDSNARAMYSEKVIKVEHPFVGIKRIQQL